MSKVKKSILDERAFTLIEMMIVLMIISVLLHMSKNNTIAQEKSCEATIELLQAQVGAYQIEHNSLPSSLATLVDEGYIQKIECPGGETLQLTVDGKVVRGEAK